MRTLFFVFVLVTLMGCAPASPVVTAAPVGPAPLDQSLATPVVGGVTVLPVAGKTSLALRSQPDPQAPPLGEVKPGDSGKLLGIDPSGRWMLVEIKQQTGWAPVQYLDYTIAQ